MMWPTLLLGLLVASVAGWIVTVYFQTQRIRRLERSHEEIQVEETLVFDFLHGVGEIAQQRIWQWVDHGGGIAVWESRSGCLGARQWPEGCAVFTGRVRRF